MRDAGMVVESVKGECNFGQHEIAFKYADAGRQVRRARPLQARAPRRSPPSEGCSLTFMAKYDEREGNSCHIHLSLRDDDDQPVFAGDDEHGFSQDLRALPRRASSPYSRELSLLPRARTSTATSASSPVPSRPPRCCGASTTARARSASSATGPSLRVECRIPGGDVNPYLAIAALVAAGLRGVEEALDAAAGLRGQRLRGRRAARARRRCRGDRALRRRAPSRARAFGDEVVDHYVHAARVEVAAFDAAVTDWERYRGFERL